MVWSPAWPQTHYVVENDPEFLIPKFPLPWGKLRLQDFVTTLSRVTCYLLNIIHISTKMSPQKVLSCQPQWCKHVIPAPGKRQVNSVSLRPARSTEQIPGQPGYGGRGWRWRDTTVSLSASQKTKIIRINFKWDSCQLFFSGAGQGLGWLGIEHMTSNC